MFPPRYYRLLGVLWLSLCGACLQAWAQDSVPSPEGMAEKVETALMEEELVRVVVIPVRDQITNPILYVVRRGLKEAIEQNAALVVLDMKTPGGSLDTTFEILEALEKFVGSTATYVNNEALSAGSLISAMTDDIYFAPDGVIGAAAPVLSSGAELDESMKQKIVSYLKARMRAISEGHTYRGQVISAMIDADYELKIGEEVLKAKGELLSLTATEASKTYGEPAEPLLAAGIAESIEALLAERYGEGGYTMVTLVTTWAENLAAVLNGITPILMGLGLLGLFVEFKTPGFGLFGIGGGLLMLIVLFGHYVAGLSGHESMLFFVLGALLILVELLLLPGTIILALSGVVMMIGSLLWSMADIWPNEPIEFSGDLFVQPLLTLGLSVMVAVVGGIIVLKFLPKGWFGDRMVLWSAAGGSSGAVMGQGEGNPMTSAVASLVGRTGKAATDMYPSGHVIIDGRWYEARVDVGTSDEGREVVVRAHRDFGLVVEPMGEEDDV
ncbi:MAG: hypothetical protein J6386_17330 [Candidatus Synoicihabitans palmerolidicus]|nr:hypothetical protein [Candidatus Synoicihabitans palmerolidicus]